MNLCLGVIFWHSKISWDELDVSGEGEVFLDIVQDILLCQHVTQATRGANILEISSLARRKNWSAI